MMKWEFKLKVIKEMAQVKTLQSILIKKDYKFKIKKTLKTFKKFYGL